MNTVRIADKIIGENYPVFIIAEAGVNYYEISEKKRISLIDSAKLMIKEASENGADAIKFQTYKAERIVLKNSPAYWDTKKEKVASQYELFKKYDNFDEDEFKELAKYAKKQNIIFLSTPFHEEAVDFLDELVPAFKISSSDITNLPLIKYIAKKGKPIFLSTGASTICEIEKAINTIEGEENNQIVVMHCILEYPTKYENANLNMIKYLRLVFPERLVGYSDHTIPNPSMLVLTVSALLGAKVIEKHFTLDKSLPGNDHYHAMDPADLKKLVNNINLLEKILGQNKKKPIKCELSARKNARRSIVAKTDISYGKKITQDMLTLKRPGIGIEPEFLSLIIGRKIARDIKKDEIIKWEDLI